MLTVFTGKTHLPQAIAAILAFILLLLAACTPIADPNSIQTPPSTSVPTMSANEAYNVIRDYVYAQPSELREHYAGAYTQNGRLVVRLCCDTDACRRTITETLGCQDVTFAEGVGSEYEAKQKLDAINRNIALLTKQVHQEKTASAEAITLIEALPCTEFDDETLTTTVVFTVSAQVKAVVDKYQLTRHESAWTSDISSVDQPDAAVYCDLVTAFRTLVSDDPALVFAVTDTPAPTIE